MSGFVYIPERERWRTSMLLAWKKGDLQSLQSSGIIQLIAQFAAAPWPRDPVRKLSVRLINTYTGINEVYYEQKKRWNGNFTWRSGQQLVLDNRYDLKELIGSGAFGVVMQAIDLQTNESVAIKIIKARPAYTMQAKREIKLLKDLRTQDSENSSNVVELRSHFTYRNHECLVFEMLSANLYTLLERVQFHGFSLPLVRKFADQLLNSLEFLARPDVRVIHTDIKPENICIRNSRRSAIKLIDFGSSCKEGQRLFSYIQSRYYRAPEVLLNLEYTVAIDMWSLACVLVEMHVGRPLFSGDNQEDQLRKIMQMRGMPPDHMIDAASETARNKFFIPSRSPRSCWQQAGQTLPPKYLEDVLGVQNGGPEGRWRNEPDHTPGDYHRFQSLIERMLELDPAQRITPSEALSHDFITVIPPRRHASSSQQEPKPQRQQPPLQGHGPQGQPQLDASMQSSTAVNRASQGSSGNTGSSGGSNQRTGKVAAQSRPSSQGGQGVGTHISQQHQTELSSALEAIGCPQAQLENPMNQDTLVEILMNFTMMDENALLEARRRFMAFVDQPLRQRRDKALQHLLALLREQGVQGATTGPTGSSSTGAPCAEEDPMAIDHSFTPPP